MLVSNYKHKDKYVLYSGGKSIKIAFSEDLKTWKVFKKPVFQLPGLNSDCNIRIKRLKTAGKRIELTYCLYKKGKKVHFSEKTIFFNKKNPKEILTKRKKRKTFSTPFLKKLKNNPILKPIVNHFWESKLVLNPAVIHEAEKIHLVYRAIGENGVSVLGYASSKDGIHIDERLKDPIYVPGEPFELNPRAPQVFFSGYMSGGGCGGCEDPRLTKIKDRIYMTYVAFNGREFPRMALTSIKVDDFLNKEWNWETAVLISPPGEMHKNWVIFPEKINNKYAILHSISPEISIAYLDSLKFDDSPYINSYYNGALRKNCWDSWVRGVGPPPIKTKDGWLVLYHAMDKQDPSRYKVGAMILDHQNPAKVLYRSSQPILEPDEKYENEGFKGGVVYACGATIMSNSLFVYYGAADTAVCGATANLNEFLDELKYSGSTKLAQLND